MRRSAELKKYVPLAFHVALGGISPFVSSITTIYGIIIIFYFLLLLIQSKNKTGEAHKAAVYIASMEIWFRMTGASLPWEFGKIAAIFFLTLGMFLERKRNYNWLYGGLLFLLLPSIILSAPPNLREFREALTFQLGGMILLVFALLYFSRRYLTLVQFVDLLRYALLPVVTILVHIIFRSPSISQIQFQLGANFAASGGYGPNQVSTILGLGVLITGFVYLWKLPPLISRRVDIILLALFALRALLTFSRGGLVVAVFILSFAYLIMLINEKKLSIRRLMGFLLIGLTLAGTFFIVNRMTGDALFQRFRGDTYTTANQMEEKTIGKVTSGRADIVRTDIEMFLDYPIFGAGLGMSNQLRPSYGYNNISHIEQSRLLSEHGIFGLLILAILIGLPFMRYFSRRGLNKSILLLFTLFSFLTMAHSATRLAIVGLYFGIGFIRIAIEKHSIHRQQTVETRLLTDQH